MLDNGVIERRQRRFRAGCAHGAGSNELSGFRSNNDPDRLLYQFDVVGGGRGLSTGEAVVFGVDFLSEVGVRSVVRE